jgi:quercetin dioxygenase-like cupin family protein
MQAYTWETVAVEQLTDSIRRRMIVGTREMLVRWEFRKGALAARHSHPNEQIVMMIEGKLHLTVGNTSTTMMPGDIVVIPPDVPHEALALEDTVVLDIFSPLREDFLTGDPPSYLIQAS